MKYTLTLLVALAVSYASFGQAADAGSSKSSGQVEAAPSSQISEEISTPPPNLVTDQGAGSSSKTNTQKVDGPTVPKSALADPKKKPTKANPKPQ